MNRYIFSFPSVTIALKAQALLKGKGIKSDIIRTPKTLSVGCGYSVSAVGDVSEISELFEKNGISPKAVTGQN